MAHASLAYLHISSTFKRLCELARPVKKTWDGNLINLTTLVIQIHTSWKSAYVHSALSHPTNLATLSAWSARPERGLIPRMSLSRPVRTREEAAAARDASRKPFWHIRAVSRICKGWMAVIFREDTCMQTAKSAAMSIYPKVVMAELCGDLISNSFIRGSLRVPLNSSMYDYRSP